MNKGIACLAAIALYMLGLAAPVHAYIGPGAGAGVIAVLLGLISSIFLLFLGILWYPFKRVLKTWKKKGQGFEMDRTDNDKLDTDHNSLCHCDRTGPDVTSQTNNDRL